jgi:hypothetical protein
VGVAIGRNGMIAVQGARKRRSCITEETQSFSFDAEVFSETGGLINADSMSSTWRHVLEHFRGRSISVVLPDPAVRLLRLSTESGKLREEDIRKLLEHHAGKKGFNAENVRSSWKKSSTARTNEIAAIAAEASLCELLEKVAEEYGSFMRHMAPMFLQEMPVSESVQLCANDDFWSLMFFDGEELTMVRTGWIDAPDWHEHAAEETQRYMQAFAASNPRMSAGRLLFDCSHSSENSCHSLEKNLVVRGLTVVRDNAGKYRLENAATRVAFL